MLTDAEVDELENFVCHSRKNRQIMYLDLAVGPFKHWRLSENTIMKYHLKRGHGRFSLMPELRLAEKNKIQRIKWAEDHAHWNMKD